MELAAILALTTAMITNPGKDPLSVDAYIDSAVCAVHVFSVILAAVFVNISFNWFTQ